MIEEYIENLKGLLDEIVEQQEALKEAAQVIKASNLVLIMGNGGSAATAQHFTQGLMDVGVKAICLTDNQSLLTALSNDETYEEALVKQMENWYPIVDTIVLISVSGGSLNLVVAAERASKRKYEVIGLLGKEGKGVLSAMITRGIVLSGDDFGQVEDAHLVVCHLICRLVEDG